MEQAVGAVLTHGCMGPTAEEQFVEQARLSSLSHHIEALHEAGAAPVVVATDADSSIRKKLAHPPDQWITTPHTGFHFGEALKQAISSRSLQGCVYIGSGAGVLLRRADYRALVSWARNPSARVLLNNLYSTDFASFSQAQTLLRLELPRIDNTLGMMLTDQDMPCRALPRNLRTQYDIDTPTDVLLLKAIGRLVEEDPLPFEEQAVLSSASAVMDALTDRSARLWIYGRVNPATWAWFQSETACQTAGVIEGRGLRAHQGLTANAATDRVCRSIFEQAGWDAFFASLGKHASAAILDTRPLLTTFSDLPSAADRFRSDLLRIDRIEDPTWRSFTQAAQRASLPVLLGGHNLVSGGLYAVGSACWKRRNLERRLCTKTTLEKKE